ncbi:DSD1 family PLP-dependent enzyme [Taklimakanibacter deserti]|uniref:DSD1 family PLP-dependent enzyme n=1 Tax=Taklimakanibacter deserti TaxID=2267839 RepID=UPI000E6508ED
MRRDEIKTPALILDLDHLDRNIEIMTAWAKSAGVALRPHAKSHKSPDIARRLLKAGALGACCATIAEAEALAAAGITGLHITSPMTTTDMLARLHRLLARGADIMVVADDPRNVDALGKIALEAGRKLPVIVEIDVGTKRTGCVEIGDAVALAKSIAQNKALAFAGVQAYWGHLQQLMPFDERKARVALNMERMRKLIAALEGAGLPPRIITGSGTGTHWLDAQHEVFTELQAGSFVFLDSCYGPLPLSPDGNPFTTSLFVAAGVVTANRPDSVTVNAGFKALATDSGTPQPVRGIAQGASYRFMGDEHGVIDFDPGAPRPELGAVIELVTSHCDPTVNLHARYVVVRGDEVVDEWPILARGY